MTRRDLNQDALRLICLTSATQSLAEKSGTIRGVRLRPAGYALLKKVERLCGSPLIIVDRTTNAHVSEGSIDRFGRPILGIAPRQTLTEELIVHELSHIRLRALGFTILRPEPVLELPPSLQQLVAGIQGLVEDMFDAIDHFIFFPDLRSRGYRSESILLGQWNEWFRANSSLAKLSRYDLVARYFRVLAEIPEKDQVARIRKYYESSNRSEEVSIATQMFAQIQTRDLTPEREWTLFSSLSDLMMQPLATVDATDWHVETGGPALLANWCF